MNKLEQIKELLHTGQRSAISTKDFEAIIEQLETAQARVEELEETISDFISDNKSMYSYDDSQPVTLEEMQMCMEFTYYACLKYKQTLDKVEDILTTCEHQDLCALCSHNELCKTERGLCAYDHDKAILNLIKLAKDINVPHKKEGE